MSDKVITLLYMLVAIIMTVSIITGIYDEKIKEKEKTINQLQNKIEQQIELIDALQQ